MKRVTLVSLTICLILVIVSGISVSTLADIASETMTKAEQHFEKANELLNRKEYKAAIAEFEEVMSISPNSKIAQDAQYWIGQSYFEARQFDTTLSSFQKLLDEHPTSTIIPSTKQMIERVQQAKNNKSLFEAVKKADVEQVRLLIAEGADVDAKWGDTNTKEEEKKAKEWAADDTPLYYAADSNNIDMVKLLVEAGADVNAGQWPSLCQSLYKGNTTIVKFLIEHGANVNYPEDWGSLHEASVSNIEMVKLLLAKGADINAGYMPALHAAVFKGHKDILEDIVELLIQRGADINAKDKWGYTPLSWAINNNNSYIDILNLLIANGANVNIKFPGGGTVLLQAVEAGKIEAVQSLLEAGADISVKYNNSGHTALHIAAQNGHNNVVELLLTKGADINAKDVQYGYTALHHASRLGNKNVAELLIARDADINAKDKQGHTPLYVAVNHDYKVAEFLINKGADGSIRTESGRSLLELAQERKQLESTVPDMIFDGEPNQLFGSRIACGDVDGDGYDDILIGAHQYNSYRGRVYLFYGGPDMDTTADLILEGQNEGDFFSNGIACSDIDNDGYEDIVIAAGGYSEKRGRVYLYWGSDRNSMDANPDKIFTGEEEKGSYFGLGTPAVYDIDNDGYDDIILGAFWSGNRTGRAYLYYGNTKELMDTSHDLIFTGENPRDHFGLRIACGDVDNDGFGDIVIGSHGYPSGKQQGRAYLYYGGGKSNMDAKADVIFEVKSEGNDHFGVGIVCIDQNRDGYDDVVIDAPRYNNRQGRAYLFHGSPKRSMDTDPDMIFDGEIRGSSYGGYAVCGDIDGDNVNDLVIGAYGSGQRVGRVYVYWGKELAGPNPKPGRILIGENPKDEFGYGLACGDVNNDGFDDLVIGAYGYKAGAKQGRVYLYYGGPKDK